MLKRTWDEPGTGFHFEVTGYDLPHPVQDDLKAAAYDIVAYAMRPADHATLTAEVARLRLLTKAGAMSVNDQAILLGVLAEELLAFPADVAISALRGWARRNVFFPSLAEIVEECHKLARKRQSLALCFEPK